jgi:hypothetical protein
MIPARTRQAESSTAPIVTDTPHHVVLVDGHGAVSRCVVRSSLAASPSTTPGQR